MTFEICWEGVFFQGYGGGVRGPPLWKLVLKSDHLAALHISFLVPKRILKNNIDSFQCWLLDKEFDRSSVEILNYTHRDDPLAPWLDDCQHKIRNEYNHYITDYNEWKFSFEFDFKRFGIYHRLFHSTSGNKKNRRKFNFDTNTMDKQDFIQQFKISKTHSARKWNWQQNTKKKKIDKIQKNEIIFQLKITVPDLLADYRFNRGTNVFFHDFMFGGGEIEPKEKNNNYGDNSMVILKYNSNNVFIGFNSLMLYYEKIRTIITDILILQSDNCSIENSIIDILFKYISFYGINSQNTKYYKQTTHFGYSYNSGRMSLKKYGFNKCEQDHKKISSFEVKNKLVTTDQAWGHDDYCSHYYYFESCILKHKQLNVIFNNWMNVNDGDLFHNIIDKTTKKELIIPFFNNNHYDWFTNEHVPKNVPRICHGHKCINFRYSLDKCVKNEWILNRGYLVRCFGLNNNIILLNNGYSDKLKYCHSNGNCNQINEKWCTDIVLKTSKYNQPDYQKVKSYRDRHIAMFYNRYGCNANKASYKKTYVKSCRIRKAKFEHRNTYKKNKICKKYKKHEKYKRFEMKQELNDFLQLSGV